MALWIVATPIGTLGDFSPRAKEVLASAAVICAEDTRTTRQLLNAFDIVAPPMIALHAHNEDERADELAKRAVTEQVVLVSDAGTPAISDPGTRIVAAAHRFGAPVLSVPGPSALAAALAASGFPATPSTFLGFLPRKGREAVAREVLAHAGAVVIYEAGNRASDLVSALAELQPAREACLCREISKKFEEIKRLPLAELATDLAARDQVRGEVVLVIGPGEPLAPEADVAVEPDARLKDVAAALAARWNAPRRDVYQELLAMEARLRG